MTCVWTHGGVNTCRIANLSQGQVGKWLAHQHIEKVFLVIMALLDADLIPIPF